MAEERGESRRRRRVSWKPTSYCSLSSRCQQSSPFVSCFSLLRYITITQWVSDLSLNITLQVKAFACLLLIHHAFAVCFRLAFLRQMQWQVWSWWRLEFRRSSWHCWQCPWCLCRSSYHWLSVNTQQGPDLLMFSTRPSLSGCKTHIGTHALASTGKWKANKLLYGCRLIIGLEYALLVWWTPSLKQDDGFPLYYYGIVLLSYAGHQVWHFIYSRFLVIKFSEQQDVMCLMLLNIPQDWELAVIIVALSLPRWPCTVCMSPAWPSMPKWVTQSLAGPIWPCWTQSLTSEVTGPLLWRCGWWIRLPGRSVRGLSGKAVALQRRQG